MEFHTEKCEVSRVSRKLSMIKHEYKLSGKVLATANLAKYLGVTINVDLRWNRHIDNITSKANRTLSFVKRNLRVSSTTVKTCLLHPYTNFTSICLFSLGPVH